MPGMTRYHAPSVSYPAGRCLFEACWLLGLNTLVLATLAVAAGAGADPFEHRRAALSLAVGACAWLALAGWAGWRWRRSPVGQVLWREGQWHWWPKGQADPVVLKGVQLLWDGQSVVYLRLDAASGSAPAVWLERRRDGARWDDLRRAVWATRQAVPRSV